MTDDLPLPVIASFDDEHSYLSNSYLAPTPFQGNVFPTSEHAFVAAGAARPDDVQRVLSIADPGDAAEFGLTIESVPEWDIARYQAMEVIVVSKFAHNADLAVKLAATMGSLLVNGNTEHDQTWGNCTCPRHEDVDGDNALGVVLMAVRMRLVAELEAPDPLK